MNHSGLTLVIIFPIMTTLVRGSCFFPTEIQGSYAVQYTEGDPNDIWYRSVSISYDLISGLGSCVFRQSSLYVLRSEAGCYKCAWIRQRSDNVLSLSQSQQCHNTAESAWQYCANIRVPTTTSMLYRAGNKVRASHCPITGRFSVSCYGGDVSGSGETGQADTCPDESLLSLTCPGQEPLHSWLPVHFPTRTIFQDKLYLLPLFSGFFVNFVVDLHYP